MAEAKMAEAALDASLDAYLHAAQHGDVNQARNLHDLLKKMLTEQESEEGRYWLTDHARLLLAQMHGQLSHCEETGNALSEHVLDAVRLRPRTDRWQDTCKFVNDLRIALAVTNELCDQTRDGCEYDLDQAAGKVAEGGEFGLEADQVKGIYEEIAATVGGFKEMTDCAGKRG